MQEKSCSRLKLFSQLLTSTLLINQCRLISSKKQSYVTSMNQWKINCCLCFCCFLQINTWFSKRPDTPKNSMYFFFKGVVLRIVCLFFCFRRFGESLSQNGNSAFRFDVFLLFQFYDHRDGSVS